MKNAHINDTVFYVKCFCKTFFLNLTPKLKKKITCNCKPTQRKHPFIVSFYSVYFKLTNCVQLGFTCRHTTFCSKYSLPFLVLKMYKSAY